MKFVTMLVASASASACALAPAAPAVATPAVAAQAPVLVARYGFDTSTADGALADLTGRGTSLRVRAADGGVLRFIPRGTGRAVAFPSRCAADATTCPRVILEGGDDADLDPGVRPFRYGAYVLLTSAQAGAPANVMQKGVATVESQWKMQVSRRGKPNCVLVGRGSRTAYVARAKASVFDGQWHHISCRRTATSLTVSIDDAVQGSATVPADLDISNALPLRMGGRNLNSRGDQFTGALDEAYVTLG